MLQFLTDWKQRSSKHYLESSKYHLQPQQPQSTRQQSQSQPSAPTTTIPIISADDNMTDSDTSDFARSTSWESWTSSLTTLHDWHDPKRPLSFKDDYISFPSLQEDEHGSFESANGGNTVQAPRRPGSTYSAF